jgi:hypothetical protein
MRLKRAYFFVIDSLLALLIMTLGVLLVFSFHKYSPSNQQISVASADVLSLMNTKVMDLNDGYCGVNSNLTRNGNITNLDNSMIEEVALFYYRNKTEVCSFCTDLIHNVIYNVTSNVPQEFNFRIDLDGSTLYSRNNTPIETATLVVPSRKIVQSLYKDVESAGPYLIEVYVWR